MRCCGRQLAWDFLQRRLVALCRRLSGAVARRPYPFILVPVLLSCVCSIGWTYRREGASAVYMYTPTNARSKDEQRLLLDAFPQKEGTYVPGRSVVISNECHVIVLASDGGSVLREEHITATERLNEFIMNDIVVRHGDANYSYSDVCQSGFAGCYKNPHVLLVSQMRGGDAVVNMSYPTATYDGHRYYLASALGGVSLDDDTHQIIEAQAWTLLYPLKEQDDGLSTLWETEFEKRLLTGYSDPLITYSFSHSSTLDNEVARNGRLLQPRFVLMFAVLVAFALSCSVTFVWTPAGGFPWRVDWLLSRPYVVLAGVIGAAMGVASAIGLLCFVGLPFATLVKVMPFLIVAVRLDNTFLMIGALDLTERRLPAEERIVHAMSEAAVSITITVLTDILSFICGVFTDFPSVQIFSIYTTVAIFITFVYQLTFLLGILALSARAEENMRHSVLPCVKVKSVKNAGSQSVLVQLCCLGSGGDDTPDTPPPPYREKWPECNRVTSGQRGQSFLHRWIADVYAPFLLKRRTKLGVLLVLLLFWATSGYGCCRVRTGMEPAKLLVDHSYAATHYRNLERYFWQYGAQMQLAFLRPGDVSDPAVQKDIMEVVGQFSDQPHGIGLEGVDFWLTAFGQYLGQREGRGLESLSKDEFYDKLDYFLSLSDYAKYQADVSPRRRVQGDANVTLITGSASQPITAFRLLIGMKDLSKAVDQREAADQFRRLADSLPKYGLVAFNLLWPFVDQYEEILPNVLQEIYLSVAFMIAIALLLIPHPACAVWVALAIASIDVGVIGCMTLWGLNMDTVSMVTIIMSIGFSVDFTAHIAYAYVANIEQAPEERIRRALGTLAWPVLQGGVSTLIGVVVLADLDSYMVVSFFKTVFLVVTFGLLHALVFLPVLLSLSTAPSIGHLRLSVAPLRRLVAAFKARMSAKDAEGNGCSQSATSRGRVARTRSCSHADHLCRRVVAARRTASLS